MIRRELHVPCCHRRASCLGAGAGLARCFVENGEIAVRIQASLLADLRKKVTLVMPSGVVAATIGLQNGLYHSSEGNHETISYDDRAGRSALHWCLCSGSGRTGSTAPATGCRSRGGRSTVLHSRTLVRRGRPSLGVGRRPLGHPPWPPSVGAWSLRAQVGTESLAFRHCLLGREAAWD